MKTLEDEIRDILDYDSEETVALTFKTKVRLVKNIVSTVETFYASHPEPYRGDARNGQHTAEDFVKSKLNEKTGQGITLYEHYLAHDTTISIGTAVSWMKEYASQSQSSVLPSDSDIERQFPIKSEHTALSFSYLAENKARREGAKWFKSQLKQGYEK